MLTVVDLHVRIGSASILNGVSFSAEVGSAVGIIGPNGSGKTTLFNALSGFVVHQQGQISLAGKDLSFLPPFARAQSGIARVFQNFGIFREMTILENLVIAIESRECWWKTMIPWTTTSRQIKEIAKSFAERVKLDSKLNHKASSLSGGQMRLLEIIRALAFGADLFLLDEPTAGVSPKMKDEVAQLINHLQNLGKTTLIIEHDIHFVQSFSQKIIVLDQGRVLLSDTPERVRENELLQDIYFGKR